MKHRTTEDTLYLVGGALLGAAAMYLMDPEAGDRRRRQIAKAAEDAYDGARHTVGEHVDYISSRARDLSHQVADHASGLQDNAASYSQHLADQARGIASDLTDRAAGYVRGGQKQADRYGRQASGWGSKWFGKAQDAYASGKQTAGRYADHASDAAGDYANQASKSSANLFNQFGNALWDRARDIGAKVSDAAHSYSNQAGDLQDDLSSRAKQWRKKTSRSANQLASQTRSWFGQEPESHGPGATTLLSSALTCAALGIGAIYLLDPARGPARRKWITERVTNGVQTAGSAMRTTGYDFAHRLQGVAYQARSKAQSYVATRVDTEELIRRIRAQVKQGNWQADQVQFMADADGTITATGTIAKDQLDGLLSLLHDVPGVTHLINRIETSDASVVQAQV